MKKLLPLLLLAGIMQTTQAQTYTWSENAACIFYTNCTKCHFPGGPGPFSLLDYASAYTARFAIKNAVLTGYMPPWPPDETYQTFAHERLLSQAEKDVLVAWVDAGAPEGNTALAPPPPPYNASGSQLPSIDFTQGIGNYINTSTQDDYRCFLIPSGFVTDQTVTSFELIPGTRSMVHHVLVFADTAVSTLLAADAADPGMGYTNFGGTGSNTSKLVMAWVPGSLPREFPAGMGVKILANSYFILQIHYPQGTNGDTDSNTVLNMKFGNGTERSVSLDPILNHYTNISPPLIIGPQTTQTFTETYTIPNVTPLYDQFTVLSVAPHMHKVGRSIKAYAIKPGNDTVPLIDIPSWDFRWQGEYVFRQPIVLPEGTVLKAEAFYDNTNANVFAPNPNAWVFAGEATDDEMMMVYFSYLYAFPGDENIIVDTVTVKPMYNGCSFVGIEEQISTNARLNIYPNPAGYQFNFTYEQYQPSDLEVKLIDLSGRVIYAFNQKDVPVGTFTKNVMLDNIPPGTYMVQIINGQGVSNKPLIVVR